MMPATGKLAACSAAASCGWAPTARSVVAAVDTAGDEAATAMTSTASTAAELPVTGTWSAVDAAACMAGDCNCCWSMLTAPGFPADRLPM